MAADMRYYDAWKRGTPASGTSTLQVRLDVPGGITYAPDSTYQHNYAKRQFFVPVRPAEEKQHDFEVEIADYFGRPVADKSAFVIDDEPTPAQRVAEEFRSENGGNTEAGATPASDNGQEAETSTRDDAKNGLEEPENGNINKSVEKSVPGNDGDAESSSKHLRDDGVASADNAKNDGTDSRKSTAKISDEEDVNEVDDVDAKVRNMGNKGSTLVGARGDKDDTESSAEEADNKDTEDDAEDASVNGTDTNTASAARKEKGADMQNNGSDSAEEEGVGMNDGAEGSSEDGRPDSTGGTSPHIPESEMNSAEKSGRSQPPKLPPRPAEQTQELSLRESRVYAPSLSSTRSNLSQRSNYTATTLYANKNPDGLPRQVRHNLKESAFKYPASVGSAKFKHQVWRAPKEVQLRSAELLSGHPKDRDPGTQWSAVNNYGGEGQVTIASGSMQMISELFVPDPRPWHPLRLVRRSNPRQLLLLCAGTALNPGQAKAAELAFNVAEEAKQHKDITKKSLASYFGSTENTSLRGGLGVVFCPTPEICAACDYPILPKDKDRVELNFSRRLERPDYLHRTTSHRAALRSAIAALEYVRWEAEGFDKIVIGTHHSWIVKGITRDIWEWRRNNWRLISECVLGMPGDDVPDRDLWELLDHVVRQYEEIDCNCRFWHITKDTNTASVRLAELGALKNDQQPATVRWTRRPTPVQLRTE